jgi:hypothetical protein
VDFASPVITVPLRGLFYGWTEKDLLFTGAATILAVAALWTLTFLLEFIRAPALIHKDQQASVAALQHQINAKPIQSRISLTINGGTFERSPVTIRGMRKGTPVEEYVGVVTPVFTLVNHGDKPVTINAAQLFITTETWGELFGVPTRESERLSTPMYHHINVERVKLEQPRPPENVMEMEPNVYLHPGMGATRYRQFFAEAWDDTAYKTARLKLTIFDGLGDQWQAELPASALKLLRVEPDGTFI